MDDFIIKRNSNTPAAFKAVQIRTSTYEMLKQMQNDSGVSFVDLIDEMTRFCAERFKVED